MLISEIERRKIARRAATGHCFREPMTRPLDTLRRPLAWADARMNRLYGWPGNPLYHSGVLAASLLAAVTVTGIYLLLFYRVGSPYPSIGCITNDIVLGRFIRSFHCYVFDAALVAVLIHMVRV